MGKTIHLDNGTHTRLKVRAATEQTTINALVQRAIAALLGPGAPVQPPSASPAAVATQPQQPAVASRRTLQVTDNKTGETVSFTVPVDMPPEQVQRAGLKALADHRAKVSVLGG